jgi:hypothetical protein
MGPATDERRLLHAFTEATEALLSLAGPGNLPEARGVSDEWGFPLPLSLELQARSLWVSDVDAYDLAARTLCQRASPAALGPIRFLWENYLLVLWLVDKPAEMQARTMNLLLSEIKDWRAQAQLMTRQPDGRRGTLEMTEQMEAELRKRAAQEKVKLTGRPSNAQLRNDYGGSRYAHKSLSDLGVHAGLLAPFAFFHVPGEKRVSVDFGGGDIAARAFYLSMAFELHVVTSYNLARISGWKELTRSLGSLHDSLGENIRAISELIRIR